MNPPSRNEQPDQADNTGGEAETIRAPSPLPASAMAYTGMLPTPPKLRPTPADDDSKPDREVKTAGPWWRRPPVLIGGGIGAMVAVAVAIGIYIAIDDPTEPLDGPPDIVLVPPPPPAPVIVPPPPETVFIPPPPPAGVAPATAATYDQIVASQSSNLKLYRPRGNDRILILDFPSLRQQGQTMNRLAALVEKQDTPRNRVMSQQELATHISDTGASADTYYYGHDYRAVDLVAFFNLAARDSLPLTPEEEDFKQILLSHGLMTQSGNSILVAMPEQAVVSIVQEQQDDPNTSHPERVDAAARHTIFSHELSHGEFFTNPAYRAYSTAFWHEQLNDFERAAFRSFLAAINYDVDNEILLINEMQAYLVHTPNDGVINAGKLGLSQARWQSLRTQFRNGAPWSEVFGVAAP